MLLKPLVLVLAPQRIHTTQIHNLNLSGFDCRCFVDQHTLYAQIQDLADIRGVTVVLMGTATQNRHASHYLRTVRAELGLVAQLCTDSEDEQVGLIQAGIDWMYPAQGSTQLMVAMLLSLWNRRMAMSRHRPGAPARRCGGWVLAGHGWILEDPQGLGVSLTASERALLMALFAAPGLTVSHETLITATNRARNPASSTGPRTRLTVLVSRLRTKCRHHGVVVPIRVMHKLGYMFAVQNHAPESDAQPGNTLKLVSGGSD
ncbi:helix-turn-helix domain-containing protein [Alcaligenaceae bacterium CGII-47]|nr:helix-turn-helix domain-containing protein [Alcaligenaceae bacterium CGII-47]